MARKSLIIVIAICSFCFPCFSLGMACKDVFNPPYRHTITPGISPEILFTEIASKIQADKTSAVALVISVFEIRSEFEFLGFAKKIVDSPSAYDSLVEFLIFLRIYGKSLQADATNVDAFLSFFKLVSNHATRIKNLIRNSRIDQDLFLPQFDEPFVEGITESLNRLPQLLTNVLGLKNAFFRALEEKSGMSWLDFKFMAQFIDIDLKYLNSIVSPTRHIKKLIKEYEEVKYLVENHYWGVILYIDSLEGKKNLFTPADFRRTQIEELKIRNQIYDELMAHKTKVLEAAGIF